MIRVLDRQKGTVGDPTGLLGTACNLKITDCLVLKFLCKNSGLLLETGNQKVGQSKSLKGETGVHFDIRLQRRGWRDG